MLDHFFIHGDDMKRVIDCGRTQQLLDSDHCAISMDLRIASTSQLEGPAKRNQPRCPPVPPVYFDPEAGSRLIRRASPSWSWIRLCQEQK